MHKDQAGKIQPITGRNLPVGGRLFLFLLVACVAAGDIAAQEKLPVYPDSVFTTYYHQRSSHFQLLPAAATDILFAGNSITNGAEWAELFGDTRVKNRGISGDVTAGIIRRLPDLARGKPAAVFLLIGINDLARGTGKDSILRNILYIADYLHQQSPGTKLYVQSILPVNDYYGKFSGHTSKGGQVTGLNESLRLAAAPHHFTFIDLHRYFSNGEGKLDTVYSNDGLHLNGKGYVLWKHLLFPFVKGLQEKPSLLPLPEHLQWETGAFWMPECRAIVVPGKGLEKEAKMLQEFLQSLGWKLPIVKKANGDEKVILLQQHPAGDREESREAYRLKITGRQIELSAGSATGIFYSIQTLRQLLRDGVLADACSIVDAPAFSWRGYMIDAGRNFVSLPLLKQQIEVMAQYKLNVFHFHATENIAWRFAVRAYPQLTAPENMLRNKGMYYSAEEIKELIAFCRDRHIILVPEIDMPGHSAAFKRAMNTDMQSDSGLYIIKQVLKEFCTTYDVPYIHIGADEVKITQAEFIPEITKYIESFGKRVIGWQPGGNFNDHTIRQLWLEDKAHLLEAGNLQLIDSRHLYLNHMDPLEAVVTLFNRKIGNIARGNSSVLGATLCLWHDRAVAGENDLLRMNPVYPGMLAFAERSWRGGGCEGWVANISDADEKEFSAFENRLLEQRVLNFMDKPFPYARQAQQRWELLGPFDNEGDFERKFFPEQDGGMRQKVSNIKEVVGGTIVLRHWWAPMIKGAIDTPRENNTWYARTRIWADYAKEQQCWIGFNNISRSTASDSPPTGKWDEKGSRIWVNGEEIPAPRWKRGGQKGHAEIPLSDEGYEYREPVILHLQQGWNTVLIKAPVGSFKPKDGQNPAKWMFTFVPAD